MENEKWQAGTGLFSARGRWSRNLIAFTLLLVVAAGSIAREDTLYLAGGDDQRLTDLVSERVASQFGDRIRIASYDQDTDPGALVLALDSGALAEVRANNDEQPVVSLFSSSHEIDRVVDNRDDRFSAIYSDPPLDRQARLGRLVIPRARTAAILTSRDRAGDYEPLIASMQLMGLEARVFVVSSSDTLIRDLNRALAYGDFLLATPDSRVFNRNTVKPLLLTSYRRNRLVIGPSRPFVDAGSVASTYTPAREQVDEGLELVSRWYDSGELPAARYPEHFKVAVNEQVARSMNLPLPSEGELRESLISREDEQ